MDMFDQYEEDPLFTSRPNSPRRDRDLNHSRTPFERPLSPQRRRGPPARSRSRSPPRHAGSFEPKRARHDDFGHHDRDFSRPAERYPREFSKVERQHGRRESPHAALRHRSPDHHHHPRNFPQESHGAGILEHGRDGPRREQSRSPPPRPLIDRPPRGYTPPHAHDRHPRPLLSHSGDARPEPYSDRPARRLSPPPRFRNDDRTHHHEQQHNRGPQTHRGRNERRNNAATRQNRTDNYQLSEPNKIEVASTNADVAASSTITEKAETTEIAPTAATATAPAPAAEATTILVESSTTQAKAPVKRSRRAHRSDSNESHDSQSSSWSTPSMFSEDELLFADADDDDIDKIAERMFTASPSKAGVHDGAVNENDDAVSYAACEQPNVIPLMIALVDYENVTVIYLRMDFTHRLCVRLMI